MKVKFGNKVRVGDPCYVPGEVSESAYAEFAAVAGEWDVDVESARDDWGSDGIRIVSVALRDRARTPVVFFNTFGLGVDSGQMAFESVEVQRGGEYGEAGYYGDACKVALAAESCGVFQSGGHDIFVTSTGYGDGCYNLAVGIDKEGRAVSIEVKFIEEEDEGVCDCCGEPFEWCNCDEKEDEAEDEE